VAANIIDGDGGRISQIQNFFRTCPYNGNGKLKRGFHKHFAITECIAQVGKARLLLIGADDTVDPRNIVRDANLVGYLSVQAIPKG
jgi:hypothetical protein